MSFQKYVAVNFTDENADLKVKLPKTPVEFILRLKKDLRKKPKFKPLAFADLVAANTTLKLSPDEKYFINNGYNAYLVSKMLYQKEDFRDAFLNIHLSLEHFSKHLFVVVKNAYRNRYHEDLPTIEDDRGTHIKMSHQIQQLLKGLIGICGDLRGDLEIPPLLSSLSRVRRHGGWSEVRYYTDPRDPLIQNDFESFYRTLRQPTLSFIVNLRNKGLLR